MVAQINQHDIKWLSPSPMWDAFGDLADEDSRICFNRPAILRFNNDGFMDELLALMSYHPDKLAEWQVKPETWREPMATPKTAAKLSLAGPVSQLSKRLTREQLKREGEESTTLPGGAESAACITVQNPDKPLKLYQPTQQRFYLVTASLVCRRSGLPDRFIDAGKQEQPGFVLRRLIPKDSSEIRTPDICNPGTCDEYALVQTADGQQWRNITQHDILKVDQAVPDEERLPMFTVGFTDLENRKRKLLSGFIPVGKREAYLGAELFDEDAAKAEELAQASGNVVDLSNHKREAFKRLFEMQVAGPWKALIEQVESDRQKEAEWITNTPSISSSLSPPSPNTADIKSKKNNIKIAREQIQTISWYVLVDLVQFLKDYLNDVYKVFEETMSRNELQNDAQKHLYDELSQIQLSDVLKQKLVPDVSPAETYHGDTEVEQYLKAVIEKIIQYPDIATKLNAVDVPYDRNPTVNGVPRYDLVDSRWPRFLFPLADPQVVAPLPAISVPSDITDELDGLLYKVDQLTEWVADALVYIEAEAPEVVTFKPQQLDNGDGWFVIRCIHEQPNCGPFFPAVLSKPTEPFKMASFFDPDAPGRAVRIPMPLDISPAGLRKFNKNTSFMISDMLCGKIKSIRKITFGDLVLSVLPWPFHKDLPDVSKTGPCGKQGNTFGMFCSLSIPIVTLCAMILLIIMVTLFDMFFRWLPLLFTCFPLPGLKGKKS